MTVFQEIACSTAEELLHHLDPHNEKWIVRAHPMVTITPRWIFRGQANADWQLLPSAWRKNLKEKSLVEKLKESWQTQLVADQIAQFLLDATKDPFRHMDYRVILGDVEEENVAGALLNGYVEFIIIRDFVNLCNGLGLYAPSFRDVMRTGADFFRRHYQTFIEWRHLDFWELDAVALAQHHRVPTRLIDWTYSAKKAAYFACNADEEAEAICIFALSLVALQHSVTGIRVVNAPSHQNDFLRSQEALFTYHHEADTFFLHHGRYPSVEEILDGRIVNFSEKPVAYNLTLPVSEIPNLLSLLRTENVHLASLLPTYDNVAKQLVQDFESKLT